MNQEKQAHVIVVGNEKGGTGKSSVSMHLITALLREGLSVASIDLDGRQGTLTRYIQNRVAFAKKTGLMLKVSDHISVTPSDYTNEESVKKDEEFLNKEVENLKRIFDIIVIDTPGADNHLLRAGHVLADTLITPLNDSLIDLDVIAKIDADNLTVKGPSHYAERVWDTRKKRALNGIKKPLEWIVLRNRLSHHDAKNKRQVGAILKQLSERIGFKLLTGLGERVVYRELFLKGLTILDIRDKGINMRFSVSHIAARQEIRSLVDALDLQILEEKRKETKNILENIGIKKTNKAAAAE